MVAGRRHHRELFAVTILGTSAATTALPEHLETNTGQTVMSLHARFNEGELLDYAEGRASPVLDALIARELEDASELAQLVTALVLARDALRSSARLTIDDERYQTMLAALGEQESTRAAKRRHFSRWLDARLVLAAGGCGALLLAFVIVPALLQRDADLSTAPADSVSSGRDDTATELKGATVESDAAREGSDVEAEQAPAAAETTESEPGSMSILVARLGGSVLIIEATLRTQGFTAARLDANRIVVYGADVDELEAVTERFPRGGIEIWTIP